MENNLCFSLSGQSNCANADQGGEGRWRRRERSQSSSRVNKKAWKRRKKKGWLSREEGGGRGVRDGMKKVESAQPLLISLCTSGKNNKFELTRRF